MSDWLRVHSGSQGFNVKANTFDEFGQVYDPSWADSASSEIQIKDEDGTLIETVPPSDIVTIDTSSIQLKVDKVGALDLGTSRQKKFEAIIKLVDAAGSRIEYLEGDISVFS